MITGKARPDAEYEIKARPLQPQFGGVAPWPSRDCRASALRCARNFTRGLRQALAPFLPSIMGFTRMLEEEERIDALTNGGIENS